MKNRLMTNDAQMQLANYYITMKHLKLFLKYSLLGHKYRVQSHKYGTPLRISLHSSNGQPDKLAKYYPILRHPEIFNFYLLCLA